MNDSFISSFRTHLRDLDQLENYHVDLLHELRQETATAVEKAITTNARIGESMLFDNLQEYFETYHHSEILLKQKHGYFRESIKDHPEMEHHLENRMNLIQEYFHTLTDAISGLMDIAQLYFPDRIQHVDFIKLMVKYGIDFIEIPERQEPEKGLEMYFNDVDQGKTILKEIIHPGREYKAKDCILLIFALHKLKLLTMKPTDNKKELILAFQKTTGGKFHYRSAYNFKEDDYQLEINQKAREIEKIIS